MLLVHAFLLAPHSFAEAYTSALKLLTCGQLGAHLVTLQQQLLRLA